MSKPMFLYANYVDYASATATDTASGYAAADLLQSCQDTGWKPANTSGSKAVTIDLGYSMPFGAVALVGDYINGVIWEIRGSTDNFSTSDVQLKAPTVINTSTFVSTWQAFNAVSYRYVRLIFSGFAASFRLHHVAVSPYQPLPYLADGHDPAACKTEGAHLISVGGLYLGSSKQRSMRDLKLDFGQVTRAQSVYFERWNDACIKTPKAFFYVPDISSADCYFGWVDPSKYTFSLPMTTGMAKVAAIPFTTRLA